jgi:adenylate kinase
MTDRPGWFHGTDVKCCCEQHEKKPARPYRLVLLGGPGVGKGTQAALLSDRLKACQLSTGDLFRAAKSAAQNDEMSPAMADAMGYMERGELVPDGTVIDLVRERASCLGCDMGFMLDGFPRTVAQAEALEKMLHAEGITLDAVVNFEVPMETLVERLSGRRTCRNCKATFHVQTKPPAKEGVCDECGGELYQREDDQPDSIRVRLQAYQDSTAPLAGFYRERGLLCTVSAEGTPNEVFERTVDELERFVENGSTA